MVSLYGLFCHKPTLAEMQTTRFANEHQKEVCYDKETNLL